MATTVKSLFPSIAALLVLWPTAALCGQQPAAAAESVGSIRVRARIEGSVTAAANVPVTLRRLPDPPATLLDDTVESRAAYLSVMSRGGGLLPAPPTPSRTTMTPEEARRGLAGAAGTTPPNTVGGGVTEPILLQQVQPSYSDEARQNGIQGTVEVMVVIREDGSVGAAQVTRSLGNGLDEKAVEALRQWRFRPATKSGIPVASYIAVLINFSLRVGSTAALTMQRTDTQGDATLSGLAPGRYALSGQIDGYFGAATVVVSPSSSSQLVALSLSSTGVISGRVLDSTGAPVPVAIVSWGIVVRRDGNLVFLQAGTASTNNRGEYRLTGIGAGDYHLAVRPPGQEFGYSYFPGTRDLKDTQAVSVRPGQELVGIDIEVAK